MNTRGGRALNGLGDLPVYQTQSNSEYREVVSGSQAAGDKFRCREGKSPDRQLRSQSLCLVSKDVEAH